MVTFSPPTHVVNTIHLKLIHHLVMVINLTAFPCNGTLMTYGYFHHHMISSHTTSGRLGSGWWHRVAQQRESSLKDARQEWEEYISPKCSTNSAFSLSLSLISLTNQTRET